MQVREKPGWPRPMADSVYSKVRTWFHKYESGVPFKPQAIQRPELGPDAAILVIHAYKHNIPFKLNEIMWLEQVLDYITQHLPENDPKRVVAKVVSNARINHEALQDKKRIAIGIEYAQTYLFDKTHIQWIYNILGQHSIGKLISETDVVKELNDIKQGDW